MNATADSSIVEKLKKLLTLHKDATGAEAETALAMATKLGIKHDIDISSIELTPAEQKKEEMVKNTLDLGKRVSVAQKWINWLLHNHFKVSLVSGGSRWYGRQMYFLGRKSDVEFALYVQDFLKEHMLRSWQYYQKANGVPTRNRATFFEGFYRGLDQKLAEAKKEQEQESFAAVASGVRQTAQDRYTLAVVSEKDARKAFVEQSFIRLRTGRQTYSSGNYNATANSAGFAAGRATNINRPLK